MIGIHRNFENDLVFFKRWVSLQLWWILEKGWCLVPPFSCSSKMELVSSVWDLITRLWDYTASCEAYILPSKEILYSEDWNEGSKFSKTPLMMWSRRYCLYFAVQNGMPQRKQIDDGCQRWLTQLVRVGHFLTRGRVFDPCCRCEGCVGGRSTSISDHRSRRHALALVLVGDWSRPYLNFWSVLCLKKKERWWLK